MIYLLPLLLRRALPKRKHILRREVFIANSIEELFEIAQHISNGGEWTWQISIKKQTRIGRKYDKRQHLNRYRLVNILKNVKGNTVNFFEQQKSNNVPNKDYACIKSCRIFFEYSRCARILNRVCQGAL